MSYDPDEISRTFKKHCSKCDTWNQVTVHRMPIDGDWDEAHPYFCADCVTNSALNVASVFPSRRIEISDFHTDLNRSADIFFRQHEQRCMVHREVPKSFLRQRRWRRQASGLKISSRDAHDDVSSVWP